MSLESVFANPPSLVGLANKESGEDAPKERTPFFYDDDSDTQEYDPDLLTKFTPKEDEHAPPPLPTEEPTPPEDPTHSEQPAPPEDFPEPPTLDTAPEPPIVQLEGAPVVQPEGAPVIDPEEELVKAVEDFSEHDKDNKDEQSPKSKSGKSPSSHERKSRDRREKRHRSRHSKRRGRRHEAETRSDEAPQLDREGGNEPQVPNLEDGELEDGELDDEDVGGPPQLSPHRPSNSDSDVENKPKEDNDNPEGEGGDKKKNDKKRKKKRSKEKSHKKKRTKYTDHDQVDSDEGKASWPPASGGRSPAPGTNLSFHGAPRRERSPPGPYDSPYDSPPGPYDSPSGDDDDYAPPSKMMRNDSQKRQSMLSMLSGEYVDGPMTQHEKEEMFQQMRGSNNRNKKDKNRMHKEQQRQQRQDKNPVPPRQRCKFYMEGKCAKGKNCSFSHDFKPPRKTEVCKFYINDMCAKGKDCVYMHSDYPCKYFHMGQDCLLGLECKFSHDPLNEHTRPIFEKIVHEDKDFVTMMIQQNQRARGGVQGGSGGGAHLSPSKQGAKRGFYNDNYNDGYGDNYDDNYNDEYQGQYGPDSSQPQQQQQNQQQNQQQPSDLKKIPSLFDIEVFPPPKKPDNTKSNSGDDSSPEGDGAEEGEKSVKSAELKDGAPSMAASGEPTSGPPTQPVHGPPPGNQLGPPNMGPNVGPHGPPPHMGPMGGPPPGMPGVMGRPPHPGMMGAPPHGGPMGGPMGGPPPPMHSMGPGPGMPPMRPPRFYSDMQPQGPPPPMSHQPGLLGPPPGMMRPPGGIQHQLGAPGQHQLGAPGQHQLGAPGQHQLGAPGQHQLGGPGQHQLGGPGQHQLGAPGQHQLGAPGQHQLGAPGQHQLGAPGQHQLGAPSRDPRGQLGPRPPHMETGYYGNSLGGGSEGPMVPGHMQDTIESPEAEPRQQQLPNPHSDVDDRSMEKLQQKAMSSTGDAAADFLNTLPPKQRELFLRIQQRQNVPNQAQASNDDDKVVEDDNWYSSDEESEPPKANIGNILRALNKKSKSAPAAAVPEQAQQPFDITKVLNVIQGQQGTTQQQYAPQQQQWAPPQGGAMMPNRDPRQVMLQQPPPLAQRADPRLRAADPRLDPRGGRPDPRLEQPIADQRGNASPRADPRASPRADPRASPRGSSDPRASPRSDGGGRLDPRSSPRAGGDQRPSAPIVEHIIPLTKQPDYYNPREAASSTKTHIGGGVVVHSTTPGSNGTYMLHKMLCSVPSVPPGINPADPRFRDDPRVQKQLSSGTTQQYGGNKVDPRAGGVMRQASNPSGIHDPRGAPSSEKSDPRLMRSISGGSSPHQGRTHMDPRTVKAGLSVSAHNDNVHHSSMTRTTSAPPPLSPAPADPRQMRAMGLPAFGGPRDSPPMPSLPPFIPPKPTAPLQRHSTAPSLSPKRDDSGAGMQDKPMSHRSDPRFKKKSKHDGPSAGSSPNSYQQDPRNAVAPRADPRKTFEHRSPLDANSKSLSEPSFSSFNRAPQNRLQQQTELARSSASSFTRGDPRSKDSSIHSPLPGPARHLGMPQINLPTRQNSHPAGAGMGAGTAAPMDMFAGSPTPGLLPTGGINQETDQNVRDVFKTIDPTASPFC